MRALAKGSYFWRSAAHGLLQAPFVHLIAISTIAIALFTAGLVRSATSALDALIGALGSDVRVTVYLADDATPQDAAAVQARLAERGGGKASVIAPAEALKRLERELGDLGSALANLPENPLPTTVELEVPRGQRTGAALQAMAQEIRALPGVEGVDYGHEAVERLSAIAGAARWAGLAASLVVALATVVIVSATLQLTIYARREEIEIQKLVGATDRFVKAPFLIEGVLQGLLGAAVALLGLGAFAAFAGPRLAELFAFLVGPGPSAPVLGVRLALETIAAGCALGLGGSFVAVGRFLRV